MNNYDAALSQYGEIKIAKKDLLGKRERKAYKKLQPGAIIRLTPQVLWALSERSGLSTVASNVYLWILWNSWGSGQESIQTTTPILMVDIGNLTKEQLDNGLRELLQRRMVNYFSVLKDPNAPWATLSLSVQPHHMEWRLTGYERADMEFFSVKARTKAHRILRLSDTRWLFDRTWLPGR